MVIPRQVTSTSQFVIVILGHRLPSMAAVCGLDSMCLANVSRAFRTSGDNFAPLPTEIAMFASLSFAGGIKLASRFRVAEP